VRSASRGGVLAGHPQQAAQLAERVSGGISDRFEALLALFRQARGAQTGGLGLDGDHRHVVGNDVVQLTGDAGALLHQRLVALRLIPLGNCPASLPACVAERQRGDDDNQQKQAGEPRVVSREGRGDVEEEREYQQHRPAAPVAGCEEVDDGGERNGACDGEEGGVTREGYDDAEHDGSCRPRQTLPYQRDRQRGEQVRDHRGSDVLGAEADLDDRGEREEERDGERAVRP
jgi:hypothetical protein